MHHRIPVRQQNFCRTCIVKEEHDIDRFRIGRWRNLDRDLRGLGLTCLDHSRINALSPSARQVGCRQGQEQNDPMLMKRHHLRGKQCVTSCCNKLVCCGPIRQSKSLLYSVSPEGQDIVAEWLKQDENYQSLLRAHLDIILTISQGRWLVTIVRSLFLQSPKLWSCGRICGVDMPWSTKFQDFLLVVAVITSRKYSLTVNDSCALWLTVN